MKHHPIHNLGHFAHPKGATSPKQPNVAHVNPSQKGDMKGKLAGPKVPPGNVSKPQHKKA